MSAETKADLDAALTRHIQDELAGGIITAWIGIAAVVIPNDAGTVTSYYRLGSPQQIHSQIGLAQLLERSIERSRTS